MTQNITNADLRDSQFVEQPRLGVPFTFRPTRGLIPITAIESVPATNAAQTQKTAVTTAIASTLKSTGNLNYRGQYQSFNAYLISDVVISNLSAYVALQSSIGVTPDTDPTRWGLLSENLVLNPTIPSTTTLIGFGGVDSQTGNTGSSTSVAPGSLTPSQTGDLAMWIAYLHNSGGGATISTPSGWTQWGTSSPIFTQQQLTLAAVNPSATISSDTWASQLLLWRFQPGYTPIATVTSVTVNGSNVGTAQCVNTFPVGTQVDFASMTNATFLNGHSATVLSSNGTSFTFSGITHAAYGPTADSGTATNLPYLQSSAVVSGGISSPYTDTFSHNITADSTIMAIICGANSGGSNITAVSDTLGNTYALYNVTTGGAKICLAIATNSPAGANVVTVTLSGSMSGALHLSYELAAETIVTYMYSPFDVQIFQGSTFVCISETTGDAFTDPDAWALLAQGTNVAVSGNLLSKAGPDTAGLVTLSIATLPIFANNAAAITGGLVAGNFYRTGADPDPVCVVH